jgi:hypothetical protein
MELRGNLWLIFSGAASLALTRDKNYYQGLREKQEYNRTHKSEIDKATWVRVNFPANSILVYVNSYR